MTLNGIEENHWKPMAIVRVIIFQYWEVETRGT
jgi:hypothetical protein